MSTMCMEVERNQENQKIKTKSSNSIVKDVRNLFRYMKLMAKRPPINQIIF